jgi:hypothetical protein
MTHLLRRFGSIPARWPGVLAILPSSASNGKRSPCPAGRTCGAIPDSSNTPSLRRERRIAPRYALTAHPLMLFAGPAVYHEQQLDRLGLTGASGLGLS